jgi:hypothetical protein
MSLSYKNNVYKELAEKYPTWDALKQYLESDEGGLFRIVDLQEDSGLCIIRYEKGTSNMTLPHSRWFRSVVWNTRTNHPMCVSPPKATSSKFPFSTLKEVQDAGVLCQELFDGFMINCFRVVGDKGIRIVSRSKFDAAGKFFSTKSFKQMFIESYCGTLKSGSCSKDVLDEDYTNMREPDTTCGEAAVFYSFLVQHKEHRIVKKITANRVILIHRGVAFDDGRVEIEDSPVEFMGQSNMSYIPLTAPASGGAGSYAKALLEGASGETELDRVIKKIMVDNTWEFQGVVFKDKEGNRWRFRSEKYNAVRSLLGNTPNLRERYAQLYTQNLLDRYYDYFTDALTTMSPWVLYTNTIVHTLYNYYVSLHITKVTKIEAIDKMWWPHLYALHGHFLTQLRPANKKITMNEIQLYLHKLPWQRVSFLLGKVEKMLT